MGHELLHVDHVSVDIEEKRILNQIDLHMGRGETHVIMGPNGAGKSTLGYALMGSPRYHISGGRLLFNGRDITGETVDQRAKDGLFLSFQEPLEVPGLTLEGFIRSALEQRTGKKMRFFQFRRQLERAMDLLQMDHSYAQRSLNVGFSGGEKKKAEILQLLMLRPQLAILDETDSGLDVDAVRLVSEGVRTYQQEQNGSLLIITHSTRILEALQIDRTHVLVDGRIAATGDSSLVDRINREGYESFLQ